VAWVMTHLDLGTAAVSLIPPEMPGASTVNSHRPVQLSTKLTPLRLTVVWAEQDVGSSRIAAQLRRSGEQLRSFDIHLSFRPVPTLPPLLALPGPPAQPAIDLVLLAWSSKVFDASNLPDLFPSGSAFTAAHCC